MKDTVMGDTQTTPPQPIVDELFASRSGMGTRGANNRFTAKVNCLQITTWPKSFFFQYSVGQYFILEDDSRSGVEVTPWHPNPEKQAKAKRVPRAIAKRVVANLMATNAELQPRGSYDGVDQLWMPKKIKRDTLVFLHKEPGNGEDFRVELKYRSSVSTDILKQLVTMPLPTGSTERRSPAAALAQLATPLLVVQSIIQMASRVQWLDKAGKFVVLTEPFKDIDLPGLQLFKGLYSSVKPTIDRLLVNVDVTSLLVYQSGPLLNVAASSLGPSLRYGDVRNMGREHMQRLRSFLIGVSITLTYDPRRKAKKIADVRPPGGTFFDDEGRKVSVVEFFTKSREIPIRYPDLPCITYRAKLRDGTSRNCEVPMELCEVLPNQVFKRSAPGDVMQRISKSRAAEKNAAARLLKIEGDRRPENPSAYNQLKLGDSDFIRSTGMIVSDQLIELTGRRLEPPKIHFGNQVEQIQPTRGTRFNLVGKSFLEPAKPRRIALIRFWAPRREEEQRDRRNSEGLKDDIVERMVKLGMLPWTRGGQRPEYEFVEDDAQLVGHIGRVLDKVRSRFGGRNPDLVFALVPSIADEVVHHLKHCGDLLLRDAAHCGFSTQVMQFAKLPPRGKRDAYLNNVLAKVNPRLGGVNWKLSGRVWPWYDQGSDSLVGCMIIGADVSHGAAGNVNYPSVAGVVSTVDHTYARYIGSSEVQAGGRGGESIYALDRIVAEHLAMWSRYHKDDWPERIVYYRDGVAESQLEQVTTSEVTAIRNAYRLAQKRAGVQTTADFVEITMVYAVKRHHVRMFPKDMQDRDRMGNCYAGSVFDEGIAHPTLFDFYLQSHTALQGTARPTRYIVALNQSRYTVNELQQLTYDLCFLYARATQSVSIPAPVYYADLLCGRHKYGFEYEYDFNAAPEDPLAAAQYHASNFTHEIHPVHRNPVKMYFI